MNISDFKSQLRQGGARSNQFRVNVTFPTFAGAPGVDRTLSFLANATTLPAVTVENQTVQYRGRNVNFAGERSFAAWTITVLNDGAFLVRNAFERWSHAIAEFDTTKGILNPIDYQTQLNVEQLDRNGKQIKTYVFYDAYPTSIGNIPLSYATSAIETFDVEFQYNYYKPLDIK